MSRKSLAQIAIEFNGATFLLKVASGEMMSLNEIYEAAGSPAFREPCAWIRSEYAKDIIENICLELMVAKYQLTKVKRGKCGGTWAHEKIALAYSEYLKKDARNKHKTIGLYALMFSNGIIKVGKSVRLQHRVNQHESNAKAYGLVIIDRYLLEDTEITENELLAFCRGLASKTDDGFNHHGEYFVGIDFEKIKNFLGYTKKKIVDKDIRGNKACSKACFDISTKVAALRLE